MILVHCDQYINGKRKYISSRLIRTYKTGRQCLHHTLSDSCLSTHEERVVLQGDLAYYSKASGLHKLFHPAIPDGGT